MLPTVFATRYITALREGGSVPGLVEADDDGMYVVKFRGAGQGPRALVAEIVVGELARAVGLCVPRLVLIQLDAALGRAEPDQEIRDVLKGSVGLNVGLDYLPGSATFDPVAGPPPDVATASLLALFDAFVANVDRTPRNPNLLQWHEGLWLIDHGAALYFHHDWSLDAPTKSAAKPFSMIRQHVLLPWARALPAAAQTLSAALQPSLFTQVLAAVPEAWLGGEDPSRVRRAYHSWLEARLLALPGLVEETERARSELV